MATDWAVKNAIMVKNEAWVQKAQSLIPPLYLKKEIPEKIYIVKNKDMELCDNLETQSFQRGDRVVLDFGNNHVGYFSVNCIRTGSPQDAPAFLKLRFCEVKKEIFADTTIYEGWISKGWIQEEWIHIDRLPYFMKLPRRYTFRYVCIEILDTSQKFQIAFENVMRESISAVEESLIAPIELEELEVQKIDRAAIRTLANCMQTVFEDGPKRDRRLWLGDLWLQAKVNYVTFQNYDLVKRCLYLFAGMPNQDGQIAACIFTDDEPLMDDTFLLDYSLLFVPTLLDYYEATLDMETLKELSEVALKQIEIALGNLDEKGVVYPEGVHHYFIDWNDRLDKQCAMQAVLIYAVKEATRLCKYLEMDGSYYEELYLKLKNTALKTFYDECLGVFVSGPEKQISAASQIWMVLCGIVETDVAKDLLKRVVKNKISMVTPFLHHSYLEALLLCGEKEQAMCHIKEYWGGMIHLGADTFWELFDPENLDWSPYGSDIVNSYCHAWSCTPAYFFRKYYK